jgi:hypothetical protein
MFTSLPRSPSQMKPVQIVRCYLLKIPCNISHLSSSHACVCQVDPSLRVVYCLTLEHHAVTTQYCALRPLCKPALLSYSSRRWEQTIAPPWDQLPVTGNSCNTITQCFQTDIITDLPTIYFIHFEIPTG